MKNAAKLKPVLFLLGAGMFVFISASGYLYRRNQTYQLENRRLILQNDSVLSENIELKNALQLKRSAAVYKAVTGNFKMEKNK